MSDWAIYTRLRLISKRYQEICKVLERILQSSDQVTALYFALNSRLKRLSKKRKPDPTYDKRHAWFQNFSSKDGVGLAPKDINTLSRITTCWELSEEQTKTLAACSVIWSKSPELFWHGDTADENLIRRCYNDLRRMEDVDPLRRRVILMILAQRLECEQDLLRSKGQRARTRPRKKHNGGNRSRKRVLLPSAIDSLTKDLWPQLQPERRKSMRKRLAADSLHGWKWRQLSRTEMALSLQDAATKKLVFIHGRGSGLMLCPGLSVTHGHRSKSKRLTDLWKLFLSSKYNNFYMRQ